MAESQKRRPKGTGGIYQRADGYWVGTIEAGWDSRGRRRRLYVTGKTKKICAQRLRDREREIAREGIPTEGASRAMTVRTYAEQWLRVRETVARPGTYTADRSAVTQWIVPTIGHVRLDRLSADNVRSVATAIIDAGRAESTALRAHNVLSGILDQAVQDGHVVPPGALRADAPAKNVSDRGAIPIVDAREIIKWAGDMEDVSRWLFAFLEAPRPAEALGLTWDRVDLDRGTVDISWQLKPLPYRVPHDRSSGFRIPRGYEVRQLEGRWHLVRPKTSAGRREVPLIPLMAEELAAWREQCPESPHGLVWPGPGGRPRDDKRDRQAWRDLCDRAQVASVEGTQGRRYDLYEARHTTATLLRASGASDDVIEAIMGHSSILASRTYIHVTIDQTRDSLSRAGDGLLIGA